MVIRTSEESSRYNPGLIFIRFQELLSGPQKVQLVDILVNYYGFIGLMPHDSYAVLIFVVGLWHVKYIYIIKKFKIFSFPFKFY
jgi:hypothetical protein